VRGAKGNVVMKSISLCQTVVMLTLSSALAGTSSQPTSVPATAAPEVCTAYPGLASAGLFHGRLAALPEGTVLRAGELTITEGQLAQEIARAAEQIRPQLQGNRFFLLEQMATGKLLLREAKADAAKVAANVSGSSEDQLLDGYIGKLVGDLSVTESEIAAFYAANKDMAGGAPLEQVRSQIEPFLLQTKRQELLHKHVREMGNRVVIEVSDSWAKRQAELAKDNPVDRARSSGKPALVDFGAQGCRPCDMMAPILDALRDKYRDKVSVVFVHVRQQQVLAARYGIQSIPVQVFFDKEGKEVLRHVGFYPQEEIEKRLAEMGVK
jgi:thioredoxin 1